MPIHLPLTAFALMALQLTGNSGLQIATDNELSTSVRLVETADDIRFEFTGPEHVLPSVAIDVNRNGAVDKNLDFQISRNTDDTVCFQHLIREGASSTCRSPGDKAKLEWRRIDQGAATTISFPKSEISGDGFGFGFAISLWNKTGNYKTDLDSGDYRFGGVLNLVGNGPNFMGRQKSDFPAPMMPAFHRYEGCVYTAIRALGPLDKSKGAKINAVPASCASDRAIALRDGVDALVASGVEMQVATEQMQGALERIDATIAQFAEIIEKGS